MRSLLCTCTIALLTVSYCSFDARVEAHENRPHNNYAIIVSTSRYWFNYRHHTNALLLYQYIKSYGNYTDDHIILMLADEYNVNPRNPIKNHVYNTASDSVMKDQHRQVNQNQQHTASTSLYTDDIEIDYRGEDVNVENFVNALTGRQQPNDRNHYDDELSLRPVLHTNQDSHILIYLTGHGGDLFLKFQDNEEITSLQFADMFQYMHQHNKYREILFIADTCQAFTLGDQIISRHVPNIYIVGTSLRGESSYAHVGHPIIGVSVVEKYTHYMMEYVTSKQRLLKQQSKLPSLTLSQALVEPFNTSKHTNMLHAHVGMDDSTSQQRKLHEVSWDDFFVQQPLPTKTISRSVQDPDASRTKTFQRKLSVRLVPIVLESSPLMIVPSSSSSSSSQQSCDKNSKMNEEIISLQATFSDSQVYERNVVVDHEITSLEPNHPVFILLVVLLLSFVVVGSQFC
jgi:glycosylphosphatidylinositol transamidase (GPIT) subunit GPI8